MIVWSVAGDLPQFLHLKLSCLITIKRSRQLARNGQLIAGVQNIATIAVQKSAATVRNHIFKSWSLRGKSKHGFKQSRFATI